MDLEIVKIKCTNDVMKFECTLLWQFILTFWK